MTAVSLSIGTCGTCLTTQRLYRGVRGEWARSAWQLCKVVLGVGSLDEWRSQALDDAMQENGGQGRS